MGTSAVAAMGMASVIHQVAIRVATAAALHAVTLRAERTGAKKNTPEKAYAQNEAKDLTNLCLIFYLHRNLKTSLRTVTMITVQFKDRQVRKQSFFFRSTI